MEYPESKFTKPWRRLILWVFILVFFIISPLIIAYTIGYRYDWKKGLIRETGAISIDMLPKHAIVYINNQKIRDKIPIRLNTITPNIYNLRITADNYYEWQKEIEVKNKQTVYIKEIELIKKYKPELIYPGQYPNIYLSPNGNFLVYEVVLEKKSEIKFKNLQTSEVFTLSLPTNSSKIEVAWGPQSTYFSITPEQPPYDWVYIYSIANPQQPINLSERISNKIEHIQWNTDSRDELFFSTNQEVFSFEPNNRIQRSLTKNDFIDWYMSHNELWILKTNTTTNQLSIIRNILDSPSLFKELDEEIYKSSPSQKEWKILSVSNGTVLIKNDQQSEMNLITPSEKFKLTTKQFLISDYNNWWLLWSPWELFSYSNTETNLTLLNRSGEQLQKVIPLDKYNTLLLVWGKKTSIFFPYYLVNHDFLNTSFTSVQVDTTRKIIYFSASLDGKDGLWSVKY